MKLLRWALLAAGTAGGYWLWRYLQPGHSPLILNDAVVIVTGASSGIGRAMAEAFARRGTHVVLAARRVELLAELEKQIVPYAAGVLIVPTDVTDDSALAALVERTLAAYGRIDILVNNAGVIAAGQLHNMSRDDIRRVLRTNLEGAMCLTQLVLPTMLAQRSGTIVNIASTGGRLAVPLAQPYIAAKHGMLGMSDALRRELFGTGVLVTSVLPYWTRSEMIPPELERTLTYLDSPATVAERTISGLLRYEKNIVFGDWQVKVGMWLERHFPRMMNLFWRMTMTPAYIDSAQRGRQSGEP